MSAYVSIRQHTSAYVSIRRFFTSPLRADMVLVNVVVTKKNRNYPTRSMPLILTTLAMCLPTPLATTGAVPDVC
jgi:hypothetical protein